jgi:chemotaxis methyl-accepting protein methylase
MNSSGGMAIKRGEATLVSMRRPSSKFQGVLAGVSRSRFLRKYLLHPFLVSTIWVWKHLLSSLTTWGFVRSCGTHLHSFIQLRATRNQSFGTFFFRNRPELELLIRLLKQRSQGANLDLTVLASSKGAEVYSISYAVRCSRPDLSLRLHALDIDKGVLEFAEAGTYSLKNHSILSPTCLAQLGDDVSKNTFRDQKTSIFERMSSEEIKRMFERKGELLKVKPEFRMGITWNLGDARDPQLVEVLGLQDIVFANRFLCHMRSEDAEVCLRNIVRLVKPGGYLFVSGVDLDVRSNVARELGWIPVTELIREIHEGDPSLRRDWPLEYWGLEPFDPERIDWQERYASVFQLGGMPSAVAARSLNRRQEE